MAALVVDTFVVVTANVVVDVFVVDIVGVVSFEMVVAGSVDGAVNLRQNLVIHTIS